MARRTLLPIAIVFIAFVLAACGGGGGSPQPKTYTVSGIVVDDGGDPIDGVTLTIGTTGTIVETKDGGKWTASGLTGTVTVTPTHDDYTFEPESVSVTKGASNIKFTGTKKSEPGDPGNGDPGDGDPGNGDPGNGDPGDGDPGNGDPGEALEIEVQADTSTVYVRQSVDLAATVSGGSEGNPEVTWSVDPAGGSFSPTTGLQVTWTAPDTAGEYAITATVKNDEQTDSDTVTITVDACDGCIFSLGDLHNTRGNLNGNYILMNDIDASATETDADTWGPDGFQPIGTGSEPFTGTFDGGSNTITGLYMRTTNVDQPLGLFGTVGAGATIENVHLEDVNVEGTTKVGGLVGHNNGGAIIGSTSSGQVVGMHDRGQVGGLVGDNESGTIEESSTGGTVNGNRMTGGLVGINRPGGTIINSSSDATVTGTFQAIGGLVGRHEGTIEDSFSTGDVSGVLDVGGLVGRNQSAVIRDSYSTGNVTGTGTGAAAQNNNANIGGLVGAVGMTGDVRSEITDSYSTSKVTGPLESENVGGLIGSAWFVSISNSSSEGEVDSEGNNVGGLIGHTGTATFITDSYSTATVEGFWYVGGLVGYNEGATIERSYTLPHPATHPDTHHVVGNGYVGGLVGRNGHTITDSYSWSNVGSLNEAGGLVGGNDTDGRVKHSYSIGTVEGTPKGGLVGTGNNANVTASYWDKETSLVNESAGGDGRTTFAMQQSLSFPDWDRDVWVFRKNQYPDLRHNPR